jgi:hypothetical protein
MQVVDKGEDYKVKVKKWLSTIMTADGDTRMKGENKKVMSYFIIVHLAIYLSSCVAHYICLLACLLALLC